MASLALDESVLAEELILSAEEVLSIPADFDQRGFDQLGLHKDTGTTRDLDGYDLHGFDRLGYDRRGYDIYGVNQAGFSKSRLHHQTGDQYCPEGYNWLGYDKHGFNRIGLNNMERDMQGFNIRGWNADGVHRVTGTRRDPEGYDHEGLDAEGRSRRDSGYDEHGFLVCDDGYLEHDMHGFDWRGIHKETGSTRDPEDYDCNGFNRKARQRCTGGRTNWMGFTADGTNFFTGLQYDIHGFGIRRWYA